MNNFKSKTMRAFFLVLWMPTALLAQETVTVEQALIKCKKLYPNDFEAKKRLSCFDSINTPKELLEEAANTLTNSPEQVHSVNSAPVITPAIAIEKPSPKLSYLERKWRLTSQGDWNISDFETYKSNYLLITKTNNTNDMPQSPSQLNNVDRNLDDKDLKFQISLKTEVMNNIPLIRNLPYVTSSRIWAAYSQQSNWQVFDSKASRPLRENNYEPEIMLSLGIDNQVNGEKKHYIPRMLNLGLVHQSNGRSNPTSRSWNRLYLESGWELTDNVSLMVRPWWRIPESQDDNPDIEKYLGYGDMAIRWEDDNRKNAATLTLRNNLRSDNKGYAQLDLQRQVLNNPYLKLHLMASTGYGASLLDYNYDQTIFGIGISLGE
ncbi:phospholipase A [Methylotenera versatilis]|uniref:Phospholipase A1 n=1 Tax=Methylotenera versatilis (strain 301) TaxID=666681 RepID=D7DM90_METV0|nr:phospholipase A [Methylotenera versatilis]ADI28801.1 Phospholipase A(2) [Methylotenera versatilis 301]